MTKSRHGFGKKPTPTKSEKNKQNVANCKVLTIGQYEKTGLMETVGIPETSVRM